MAFYKIEEINELPLVIDEDTTLESINNLLRMGINPIIDLSNVYGKTINNLTNDMNYIVVGSEEFIDSDEAYFILKQIERKIYKIEAVLVTNYDIENILSNIRRKYGKYVNIHLHAIKNEIKNYLKDDSISTQIALSLGRHVVCDDIETIIEVLDKPDGVFENYDIYIMDPADLSSYTGRPLNENYKLVIFDSEKDSYMRVM